MGYYSNLRKLSEGETINDNESDEDDDDVDEDGDDDDDDDDEDGDDDDNDLEAVIMISHVFDSADNAASLAHLYSDDDDIYI